MVESSQTMGIDPLPTELELWGPSIDGEEIRRLRSRYQERVSDDEWDDVVQTATSILGRCPTPTDNDRRVTGLALGKVQSGKTLSYTSLIALAIDNGYRVTVVLAGTKNPLLGAELHPAVQRPGSQTAESNAFQEPDSAGCRGHQKCSPWRRPCPDRSAEEP